jgi:putative hydrolase of the HAD superfamily
MTAFTNIDTWVFDLDNTLYPASCRLFDQMHVKMGHYVMQRFGVDYPDAKRIQKELYYKYGTTLRGLMVEHGEAPEDFLDQVHDIDYAAVQHAPELRAALSNLPGRRLIFTNGTTRHARAVTDRLGVTDLFDAVYDIVDSDYIPKPDRAPYERFLTQHAVTPKTAAFFEDLAHNLAVPHDMGMATVLVTCDDHPDAQHLNSSADHVYVQHQTNNLSAFLRRACEERL